MKPHYTNTNNPIDFPKSENKMNERIESIAVETLSFLRHNVLSRSDMEDISIPDVFMEKFAELIVRECADVLRQESERLYKLASEEEDDVFAGNFEICAEKCIANEIAIKDHFGVKE